MEPFFIQIANFLSTKPFKKAMLWSRGLQTAGQGPDVPLCQAFMWPLGHYSSHWHHQWGTISSTDTNDGILFLLLIGALLLLLTTNPEAIFIFTDAGPVTFSASAGHNPARLKDNKVALLFEKFGDPCFKGYLLWDKVCVCGDLLSFSNAQTPTKLIVMSSRSLIHNLKSENHGFHLRFN